MENISGASSQKASKVLVVIGVVAFVAPWIIVPVHDFLQIGKSDPIFNSWVGSYMYEVGAVVGIICIVVAVALQFENSRK